MTSNGPKKPSGKRKRKASQVPFQYLGYSLQTTRMLARLLQGAPGTTVSIEVFEDVGVVTSSGEMTAEQNKSATSSNPIANRSRDLWKTFSNWIDFCNDGTISPDNCKFEIYVSTPKSGPLVEAFSSASSEAEITKAVDDARTEFVVTDGDNAGKNLIPDTLEPYVSACLDIQNKDVLSAIIANFSLIIGSGSPQDELELEFGKSPFVPTELVPLITESALGWVKIKTDKLIEKGMPAVVSFEDFKAKMLSQVRLLDKRTVLSSFSQAPSEEEVSLQLKTKTYIKQLQVINVEDYQLSDAAVDFLRAFSDRVQWAARGDIDEAAFSDFIDGLVRTWKNHRIRQSLVNKHMNDDERGRLLLLDCLSHQAPIQGLATPTYFTPGSYHALADDGVTLGWHPNYEAELRRADGNDGLAL